MRRVVVPRLNIILDLICREYFSERQSRGDFDFVMPVVGGDDNEQCQIPEVSILVIYSFSPLLTLHI